jgi:hypothetical protein
MELEKTGYPRLLRSRCKNTDATLGGLTCGAIQRKVDEQDRLTQWSLVGGTVGRQHQDKLARARTGSATQRLGERWHREFGTRQRETGAGSTTQRGRTNRVDKKQWKEITLGV